VTPAALDPNAHRHGRLVHSHPHTGVHRHLGSAPRRSRPLASDDKAAHRAEHREDEHGHSHGLVHDSIKRSREGIRAVFLSLAVLGLAAAAQTAVFIASDSVALLADLIHNFGDA
jgi:hypothetical protein